MVPNPQAAPSSYFDATFQASAATRYRVWLRIHPQSDSKWNDSVYVQFSDSVDAQGVPIYRTGHDGRLHRQSLDVRDVPECRLGMATECLLAGRLGRCVVSRRRRPQDSGAGARRWRRDRSDRDQPGAVRHQCPGTEQRYDVRPEARAPAAASAASANNHAVQWIANRDPGTLRASDFDNGGEGAAYHDLTPGILRWRGPDIRRMSTSKRAAMAA